MADRVPELVMLVEDELFVALDVQTLIEAEGMAVDGPYVSLAEADAAVARLRPGQIACAVLDVRLEDGDVFPAADRLAAAGVPIIFHSGHADARELAARYPGAAVCAKPCAPSALRAALRGAVG